MSSCSRLDEFVRHLRRFLGETVTIYTTSGGDSGRGFTGVLIEVNCDFVRLISDIGPAPACALGSCCDKEKKRRKCKCDNRSDDELGGFSDNNSEEDEFEDNGRGRGRGRNRINCGLRNTGAIVDIPTRSIAAFVHNTLGK